ncbi:MAG: folate-binding protein [Acidobacteriaceae bacterium]|nr:folate-binding protein [Acidobacteriaceae bacterium]
MISPDQIQPLLESAALARLDGRAFLRITGSDATRWLNGMVTNSIQALQPGQGSYNFLLNAQGRIQGDSYIYREHGEPVTFLLETSTEQIEALQQLLDKFIIMDDVELSPALTGEPGLLLLGPSAPASLQQLGLTAPAPLSLTQAETAHGSLLILTPQQANRFELFAAPSTLAALQSALSLPEAGADVLEAERVLSGTPLYGTDIRNTDTAKDLPQETNQPHALHFNKGCYLGQEIVERIRSRGQVHRLFTAFELSGALPTELPAPLEANGKSAGELTSVTQIGDKLYALGYARREFLEIKTTITYAGGQAIPRK